MNKENKLTIISFCIDCVAIVTLLYYFIAVAPYSPITDLRGFLILSPPLFGILGLITAIIGRMKRKTNLSTILIFVNVILLLWWPIVHFGGTLKLGA